MSYIKEFKVDTSYLTKEEKEILSRLVEASMLVAKIYELQQKNGLYPKGATRKEIEKAAMSDPQILSPYSVLERGEKGQLKATLYHIKYKQLLVPVAEKLTQAANISQRNKEFSQALLTQAKALLDGNYTKAQIAWLKLKPYILNIVIGPIERIEDNLFFTKRSYQAFVGVMNKNITDRANTLREVILAAREREVLPTERVDFMKKATLRVDDTAIFAGMIANYDYTATTLPNDINLLEKYGSEAWIFMPSVRENFEKRHLHLFNLIFAPHFKSSFDKEQLFRGYLLMVTLHEIARIVVRYRFAIDRLKELYPVFNELTIEAQAVKMSGILHIKDFISQKEMEAILVMFLTRIFDGVSESLKEKSGFEPLVLGNAVLLNTLIESGALQLSGNGISWPNFTKMFIAASNMADQMEKVLSEGSYADAQHYLKKHSSLSVFKRFNLSF